MLLYVLLSLLAGSRALTYEYLDPTKLQTFTTPETQRTAALKIIQKYSNQVTVEVNPLLFTDNKDTVSLRTLQGELHIRASTGVAAVWGFNYYLKKYCKSHIGWQVSRVEIPNPLPEVDEVVVANDRFRYYQNVCTVSYSFVWWNVQEWTQHIEWMALNGLNIALAPVAQEAAWFKIYKQLGMTEEEMNEYFTGPAFLSWLRMGNVHGWAGPLHKSWHDNQLVIQAQIIDLYYQLGIVPVFPAFNGHVPKAFARIYPNASFFGVERWNKFDEDHCCGLFLDPNDPLFKTMGQMFLREMSAGTAVSHIYTADPFNEVKIQPWSTALAQETAKAIYSTISEFDDKAVWLLQNWMFVSAPVLWPIPRVHSFLTSVPIGRMLILDLQAEQWPQYELYDMYYGQPFIWCMLHNFGGTLGMFGNVVTINKDVYEARAKTNSTMIGIGLTPEGINQNYVVYDLMLESAWRKGPVPDIEAWAGEYAERRYGCNATTEAWKYLLKSVYSFNGLNMVRGKYVITRRPSFKIKPWAWYSSHDLFEAFRRFVFIDDSKCFTDGFYYDLVDLTRQALQYRCEQLYVKIVENRLSTSWVLNASIAQYIEGMSDIESVLSTSDFFTAVNWLEGAKAFATNDEERYDFELNARNQISLWGPNGEISDYAGKQWTEVFANYYRPRWSTFLDAALDAVSRGETFDEKRTQSLIRATVEEEFMSIGISRIKSYTNSQVVALKMYEKWATVPDLEDLPQTIIRRDPDKKTTLPDVDYSSETVDQPTVTQLPTTPTF